MSKADERDRAVARSLRTLGGCLFAAVLLLSSVGAWATDVIVSTQVCDPIPAGAAARLSPADDADMYKWVDKPLRHALTKAGHPISDDGSMDVYYAITEAPVAYRSDGPSLGRLEVDTTRSGQRALLLLNVWSTREDSILGGRKSKSGSRFATYLFMSFEINEKRSGKCLWRGEGGAALVSDRKVLIVQITETVLKFLGKAADRKSVVVE